LLFNRIEKQHKYFSITRILTIWEGVNIFKKLSPLLKETEILLLRVDKL